jgi:hypothetical protein
MNEEKWKKAAVAIASITIVAFEAFLIFTLAQPTINFVNDSPDPVEVPGYNNVTANITDASSVYIEIFYPDSTCMGNFSLNCISNAYAYAYGVATWYFNRTYEYPDPLGEYTYYVKAHNATGWSVTGPYSIVVQDTTPPSSSIKDISYWNNAAVLLNVTASDNYALANVSLWYRYSSDNASWSNWTLYGTDCNSSDGWLFSFNFPDGEGYYEFYSVATDVAGNTESKTVADETAGYDITPPVTDYSVEPATPNGKNGWYVTPVNVTLTATDAISGVAHTEYRIDGGLWLAYTGKITLSEGGECIIEFYSVDNAGNQEETKNVTIKVDTTSPLVTLQRPVPGYLYLFDRQIWPMASGNTVIIGRIAVRVIAYDADSGINNVSFYVDGILQNIDLTPPYEWLWRGAIGWKYLYAVAYNKAGLKEETIPISVFIFSL